MSHLQKLVQHLCAVEAWTAGMPCRILSLKLCEEHKDLCKQGHGDLLLHFILFDEDRYFQEGGKEEAPQCAGIAWKSHLTIRTGPSRGQTMNGSGNFFGQFPLWRGGSGSGYHGQGRGGNHPDSRSQGPGEHRGRVSFDDQMEYDLANDDGVDFQGQGRHTRTITT
jgi:hypothetical protein